MYRFKIQVSYPQTWMRHDFDLAKEFQQLFRLQRPTADAKRQLRPSRGQYPLQISREN